MKETKPYKKIALFAPIACIGLVVIAMAVTLLSSPKLRTIDDTQLVQSAVIGSRDGSVLGVNSRDGLQPESVCPEEAPIMGWIDFSGNKRVIAYVPEGQFISACFGTVEEAQSNGFDL